MSDPQKTAVSTPHAPAAIGPYSQAIRLGNLLYTSGQIALDPATGQLVPGVITEQTARVLENLKAVLAAAGTGLAHTIKTIVFLKNMDDFAAMNAVYGKYLASDGVTPPARSTVQAARLPKDALVEIEVIAVIPSKDEGDDHPDEIALTRDRTRQTEPKALTKLRSNASSRTAAGRSKKRSRK